MVVYSPDHMRRNDALPGTLSGSHIRSVTHTEVGKRKVSRRPASFLDRIAGVLKVRPRAAVPGGAEDHGTGRGGEGTEKQVAISWEDIQRIRKQIRVGELVSPEQEAMLSFLGIDHDHIRESLEGKDAVREVQYKVSGKAMAYRRAGKLG